MLALPTFAPIVLTSANLLFLLVVRDIAPLESSEWDVVRDLVPEVRPAADCVESLTESLVDVASASSRGVSGLLCCEACDEAALSQLVVRDKEAIATPSATVRCTSFGHATKMPLAFHTESGLSIFEGRKRSREGGMERLKKCGRDVCVGHSFLFGNPAKNCRDKNM